MAARECLLFPEPDTLWSFDMSPLGHKHLSQYDRDVGLPPRAPKRKRPVRELLPINTVIGANRKPALQGHCQPHWIGALAVS